jgi:hypothetical protein
VAIALLCGCERGCARSWLAGHGVGEEGQTRGGMGPPSAIDCPDGLARCSGGFVEVSRLTTIAQPCKGAPETCVCPWDRAGECERGCVADEVELVVDRPLAMVQLCAPTADAGALTRPGSQASECDDGTLYRCTGGAVVSCLEHAVVAFCQRGCFQEGADIGGEVPVSREAAFAMLCSR